jgi:hypothetical protein
LGWRSSARGAAQQKQRGVPLGNTIVRLVQDGTH